MGRTSGKSPTNSPASLSAVDNNENRDSAWSPDGKRIAFHRDAEICVINSDGKYQAAPE